MARCAPLMRKWGQYRLTWLSLMNVRAEYPTISVSKTPTRHPYPTSVSFHPTPLIGSVRAQPSCATAVVYQGDNSVKFRWRIHESEHLITMDDFAWSTVYKSTAALLKYLSIEKEGNIEFHPCQLYSALFKFQNAFQYLQRFRTLVSQSSLGWSASTKWRLCWYLYPVQHRRRPCSLPRLHLRRWQGRQDNSFSCAWLLHRKPQWQPGLPA